jgi:hypothetical protein
MFKSITRIKYVTLDRARAKLLACLVRKNALTRQSPIRPSLPGTNTLRAALSVPTFHGQQ